MEQEIRDAMKSLGNKLAEVINKHSQSMRDAGFKQKTINATSVQTVVNLLRSAIEKVLQQQYRKEALEKLEELNKFLIGN